MSETDAAAALGEPRVAPSILSADFSRLGAQIEEVMDAGARVDPRRRDGRPFRPADHDRAAGRRSIADLVHERRRRPRRPPDDRGARASDRGLRRGRRRLDHLPRGGDPARQPHPAAIRELGCLAGIAINPGTPGRGGLRELRGLADIVLCMTVNPGWGGQAFIESSPDKVEPPGRGSSATPRSRSTAASTTSTAGPIAEAGARLFVAGSAVFGAEDPARPTRPSPPPPAPT